MIRPRWEWRTFGDHFSDATEAAFAALTPTAVQDSDELYLLSDRPDENIKERFDLMDIKELVEVDAAGLEQWRPIMKAQFPVDQQVVGDVFGTLRHDVPPMDRDTYTLQQFLDELAPTAGLRPVRVHKHRVRYVVNGCTSEVTDVVADGKSTRTIAIESEDASAVVEGVRQVGLQDYLNTNYGKGLLALINDTPTRYAVIDVGTNSVKFHIAEQGADGTLRRFADRAEMTRLGEGLEQGGQISAEALERTAAAVTAMADEARNAGARAIAAVGTAGFRIAANGDAARAVIAKRAQVSFEILSGDDESRLAYLAAVAEVARGAGTAVVFDTGGGSSQFTFGRGKKIDERFSVNVGAVRFTEQFGLDKAVSAEVIAQAMSAISADLARLDGRPAPGAVVGMGGGITNMTAVSMSMATYDPDAIQGATLSRAEIDRQIELYRTLSAEERRSITGLQPKRAEVILAGACIVRTILDKLGADSMTVSDRGLRHGVLMERFGASS